MEGLDACVQRGGNTFSSPIFLRATCCDRWSGRPSTPSEPEPLCMLHFPVFLDIKGRVALVLGTGEVADRKAAILRQAGAEIRFAATFAPALLDGCAIAIGADAAEPELQALAEACRARGLPVNVVDKPALCTALMPAIIDREPMTIAISTGGAAPVLARQVRQRIEAVLPMGPRRVAPLADRFQSPVRRRPPGPLPPPPLLHPALFRPAPPPP